MALEALASHASPFGVSPSGAPQAFAVTAVLVTRLNGELWSLTWALPPFWDHVPRSAVPVAFLALPVTFPRQGFDTSAAELTNCCPFASSALHLT